MSRSTPPIRRGVWGDRPLRRMLKRIIQAVTMMGLVLWLSACPSSTPRLETDGLSRYRDVVLGTTNVAIGGGGYVTGIVLHPEEPNLAYIRTDMGGFYRWNEANRAWQAIANQFPVAQRRYYGGEAIALDPQDPDRLYIAAGKYLWDDPGSIFRSVDRGNTWEKLDLDLPMGGNEDHRWLGERLAVDPFDSGRIFFGSRQDGLWSSQDGGETWSVVSSFPGQPTPDIGVSAIAFDSTHAGRLYVSAYGDGIYESRDAGQSWAKLPESPASPRRITPQPNHTLYIAGDGIARYANGQWTDLTPPDAPSEAIFTGFSIDPFDPQNLIASLGETVETQLYQSLDGGQRWSTVTMRLHNTVPWWTDFMQSQPAIASLKFDPIVPGRVWLTDWYGVWRTEQIAQRPTVWTNEVNGHEQVVTFDLYAPERGPLLISALADVDGFYHNHGLDRYPTRRLGIQNQPRVSDTYSIDGATRRPLNLARAGGRRWNSTYFVATSSDGGQTWHESSAFPSELMPLRVAMAANDPDTLVVATHEAQPLHTTDGGQTWQPVSGLPDGPDGPWYWSQPLAADAVESNVFYYYADGTLYRSDDGGTSFAIANDHLPTDDWYRLKPGITSPGELWLSLDTEGLYHSMDGGDTFAKIESVDRAYLFALGKPPPNHPIPALYLYGTVQPSSLEQPLTESQQPETLSLSKLDEEPGEEPDEPHLEPMGLFRSLDRGQTWMPIGDSSHPIGNNPNVMAASPQVYGLVFVGTNGRGIYYGTQ